VKDNADFNRNENLYSKPANHENCCIDFMRNGLVQPVASLNFYFPYEKMICKVLTWTQFVVDTATMEIIRAAAPKTTIDIRTDLMARFHAVSKKLITISVYQ